MDDVGRVAKLSIAADGNHTLVNVDVTGEGIVCSNSIVEHHGASTRLNEACASEITRHVETLSHIGGCCSAYADRRSRGECGSIRDSEAVTVAIRDRQTKTSVADGGRSENLVSCRREWKGAAATIDGNCWHNTSVEGNTTHGERLNRSSAVAIIDERDRGWVTESSCVEVTSVIRRVEDQDPWAGLGVIAGRRERAKQ